MEKLSFRSITIRKSGGFRNGLQAKGFDELSDTINIIAGPNGSGKSTTARILQQLVWHNSTKGLDAGAVFRVRDNEWTVNIDSENAIFQRDGVDDKLTGIPAVESQKVYMLALHELVNSADEDLAKRILDESIGGYDLEKAEKDLGYSSLPRTTKSGEYTSFSAVRKKYDELFRTQQGLKAREETLVRMYREKKEAEEAAGLAQFWEKALGMLDARHDAGMRSAALEALPMVLRNATGEEIQTTENLARDIALERSQIEEAERVIRENREAINNLPIPAEGLDGQLLDELRGRIESLTETERELRAKSPGLAELEAAEMESRKKINNLADPENWKGIELDQVGEIDRFFQDALTKLERKKSLQAEIERLGQEPEHKPADASILSNGIRILGDWISEPGTQNGTANWILVAIAVLALLTALAVRFAGWIGMAGLVPVIGLLVFALMNARKPAEGPKKRMRREDFEKTGLKSPEKWEPEAVSRRIEELNTELASEKTRELQETSRSVRLEGLRKSMDVVEKSLKEVYATRERMIETLGAFPDLPEKTGTELSVLYIFLSHLKEWQTSLIRLRAARAETETLEDRRQDELNACNVILKEFGNPPAGDSISAGAAYRRLAGYTEIRKEALGTIGLQENTIKLCRGRLETAVKRLQAIYDRLEIEFGNRDEIVRLMSQFDQYRAAVQAHHSASQVLLQRESEIKSHPLYEKFRSELEKPDINKVTRLIQEYSEIAGRLQDIIIKITETETMVKQAMEGNEMEALLADRKKALENLGELYEQNLKSVTGSLLLEHLRKETGEKSRPEVFRQGSRLFSIVTAGRYELKVSGNSRPLFIAYDTVTKQGLTLEEISTGTRVQLLLAIRLAFIESLEESVRLPIIADELLANSDDARAAAIIEALHGISREGRQIFYFTAQPDEVTKWISYLESRNEENYKIINLGGFNSESDYQSKSSHLPEKLKFIDEVPEPGKLSLEDYRKVLGIKPYDLISDDPENIHLAYLANNANFIFGCLKSRINRWGQLRSFYINNGRMPGMDPEVFDLMQKKVILLQEYQSLYRIGRPRPVDMDIIYESGAPIRNFAEQVMQKLEEADNNPERLLALLPSIPRFRKTSVEQIREHFIRGEYLDEASPMSREEIRLKLQATISGMKIDLMEAQDFLNTVTGSGAW